LGSSTLGIIVIRRCRILPSSVRSGILQLGKPRPCSYISTLNSLEKYSSHSRSGGQWISCSTFCRCMLAGFTTAKPPSPTSESTPLEPGQQLAGRDRLGRDRSQDTAHHRADDPDRRHLGPGQEQVADR